MRARHRRCQPRRVYSIASTVSLTSRRWRRVDGVASLAWSSGPTHRYKAVATRLRCLGPLRWQARFGLQSASCQKGGYASADSGAAFDNLDEATSLASSNLSQTKGPTGDEQAENNLDITMRAPHGHQESCTPDRGSSFRPRAGRVLESRPLAQMGPPPPRQGGGNVLLRAPHTPPGRPHRPAAYLFLPSRASSWAARRRAPCPERFRGQRRRRRRRRLGLLLFRLLCRLRFAATASPPVAFRRPSGRRPTRLLGPPRGSAPAGRRAVAAAQQLLRATRLFRARASASSSGASPRPSRCAICRGAAPRRQRRQGLVLHGRAAR